MKVQMKRKGISPENSSREKKPNSAPDLWNSVWITIGFAFCWELRKSLDQLLAIPIFLLFLLPVFDFGVLFISSTKNCNIWKFFSREGSSKFRLLFGSRLQRDFLFNWVKEIFGELLLDLLVFYDE